MARRSRLSKNFQKKSRNTLIISILGIALILILLFKFGLPLLSDASFLFGKVTSTPEDSKETDNSNNTFVPEPRLYSLPSAINKENLTVEGSSLNGLSIEIFVNGKSVGEAKVNESGEFTYEVILTDGENIIKARAIKNEKNSEFSPSQTIKFTNKGPELSIETPSNNSEIKGGNPIEIKGLTDPGSTVKVNDFQAIINSEGKWSYRLTLVNGGNDIKIISTDAAGNTTEEVIHVNYSQ